MRQYFFILILIFLGGCSITKSVPAKVEYRLTAPMVAPIVNSSCSDITLKIEPIQSSSLLLENRMYYVLDEVEQRHFTQSLWSQSPNKRVEQILKKVIIESNLFASVLDYRSNAATQWRYEVRILDAMQYFSGEKSYVKLSMNFVLIRNVGREVVSSKHFEVELPTQTADAKGGVLALNSAVNTIVTQSVEWLQAECQNY
ncbi:MAG: ABC-type transport auxiliary lipoprotein family protein [Campylobacterota bacterium]|nr:ABC-type transport auxiliary lipoprotein family protein [Campylobacterota bacterium]